jgi:ABC-2 type transport system ATP-binding protein
LWALLHEFVQGGMAVLISTPYMDEAERCDRVGLAYRGRLLLEGEPGALLAGFDEEAYEIDGGDRERVEAMVESLPAVRSMSPAGSRLRVDLVAGERASVAAALAPLGAELRPVAPSFEDLFLSRLQGEHAA